MRLTISLILILVANSLATAQEKKEAKITYEDHVKPIFRAHCFSCHNQNKKEGDLDLTNYTSMMQGGGSGAVIEPGEVGESYLFALVNHDDEPAMPPEQPKIPEAKIATLSKWIELGALENNASKAMVKKKKSFNFALTDPAIGKPAVMPLPAKLDRQPVNLAKRATGVTAIASSPWAPLVAIGGQKQVLLYDSKTRELKGVFPFPEGVISTLKFSRNGSLLLAGGGRGGASGLVVVWNIKNGERIIQVGDELDTVLAADISSDQKLVALGGPQKMIRVYSTADNSLVYEIKKHTDWVTSMEFSPDGVLLCTGDRNGGVHVWEAFSGREYLTLKGHSKSITGISWRNDSNIVATSSEDVTVRLWEMNNGSAIRRWNAHGGGTLGLEFTRDGRIVTCGRDRYAKIWDQAGKQLFAFPAFADIAMGVSHCDESNTCIAGDWTGEIRQFNAADGKQLAKITSNPQPLEQQLVLAQQAATQSTTQAQTLMVASMNDKKTVDSLVAQIASSKKQMTDLAALVTKTTAKVAADKKNLAALTQNLAGVKARVGALTAGIPELKKAKTSADLAVSKLTTDAELKKIADGINKLLATKSADLQKKNVEMTNLTKQVATLNQAIQADSNSLKKYNTDLATAKQVLAKAEPALKPAQDKFAKSKAASDAAQTALNSAKARVASLQDAIAFSKNYRQLTSTLKNQNSELDTLATSHAELAVKVEQANKTMTDKNSVYANAKSKVDSKSKEIADIDSKMGTLVKSQSTVKGQVATSQKMMDLTKATMGHLSEAKSKLEEAQKASPSDSDVANALKSMVALIENQNQKVAQFQADITAKTEQLKKMDLELATYQQKKVAADKLLKELQTLMVADQKQLQIAQKAATDAAALAKQALDKVSNKEKEIDELKKKIAQLQGI